MEIKTLCNGLPLKVPWKAEKFCNKDGMPLNANGEVTNSCVPYEFLFIQLLITN